MSHKNVFIVHSTCVAKQFRQSLPSQIDRSNLESRGISCGNHDERFSHALMMATKIEIPCCKRE